ncbi:caspase family protein [bacterium]|nr:caspase family protein [bacterium]
MHHNKLIYILSIYLSMIFLSGCVSRRVMTGKNRDVREEFYRNEYRFTQVQQPSITDPDLVVQIEKQVVQKRFSDKESRMKRSLGIPGWALAFGATAGLAAAGSGQIGEGNVVLGRDLIALGVLIPPAAYIAAGRKGEPQWEKAEDLVQGSFHPLTENSISIVIPGTDYSIQTKPDSQGRVELDMTRFISFYQDGKDMEFKMSLADEPGISKYFPVRSSLFASLISNVEYLLGEKGKPALPPYAVTKLSLFPQSGMTKAGSAILFKLTVENRGKGPFYRLTAALRTDKDLGSGNKFYFGKINPGDTKEAVLNMEIPYKFEGGYVKFEILFTEENDYIPDPIMGSFYIEPAGKSKLTYSYQLIDDNSGNSVGNGDGRIQKGEAIDLLLTVKNIGTAAAENVAVRISVPNLPNIEVNVPEEKLGVLGPGEWKTAKLTFTAKKTAAGNSVPIQLQISEKIWDQNIERSLDIPLEAELAPQILELRREVVAQAQEASIFGGADHQTSVIGKIQKGSSLLATGQLGDWYRVELTDGLKGWVKSGDVGIRKTDISADEAGRVVSASNASVIRIFEQMPPAIAIFTPESEHVVVAVETMELAGLITDDKGIFEYQITVNGDLVKSQDRERGFQVEPVSEPSVQTGKREIRFREVLPLKEGDNTIFIMASDADGLTAGKEITVERTVKMPEIWAVVVGISRYQKIRDLNYADKDAEAFNDFLIHHLNVPEDHIQTLTNEQATLNNVKKVIGDDLRRNAGQEDQVMIFFAGHGAVEPDLSNQDGDGLSKYLMMHDTQPDALYSTALPMDEVARMFGRISSDRVVYIGDACYSGASGGRTILTHQTRATLSDEFLNRLSTGKGRIILTASGANELSLEDDRIQHGVFTYHLLKALKGEADLDGDGFVSVDEAYSYVSRIVPESTGQSQHPVKKGETEGQIIIGRK